MCISFVCSLCWGLRLAYFIHYSRTRLSPKTRQTWNKPRAPLPSLPTVSHFQNWADTFRNSLLFLFFGHFGGRKNSFSRAFLLLSSPLCFLLQTRPVKVLLKRIFYAIGQPAGILLSLLPAPQQAIMSLDYGRTMRGLYGEEVWKEELAESARRNPEEDTDAEFGGGFDMEEEYDNSYDDESEYDLDD